jgi:effector-binding domain-containing protein
MEAYLNDPGEATPDEYLTVIMIPVVEQPVLDKVWTG